MTASRPLGEAWGAMKLPLPLSAAALALFALSACQSKAPTVIDETPPDPLANQVANAAPVELPPSIKASVTMRCTGDNSLVYVNFYTGNTQATLQTAKDGPATRLVAAKAGDPFTADGGYQIKGDDKKIELKQPGKKDLTCHI
ncbi:hypothetical protein [uncultured Sphingomonas sp.]|uniref:hypothetical protein n=1 Tax=uncultured Sphingomonas sp. TaxID=158754 RepID=UPI0035CAB044